MGRSISPLTAPDGSTFTAGGTRSSRPCVRWMPSSVIHGLTWATPPTVSSQKARSFPLIRGTASGDWRLSTLVRALWRTWALPIPRWAEAGTCGSEAGAAVFTGGIGQRTDVGCQAGPGHGQHGSLADGFERSRGRRVSFARAACRVSRQRTA